MARTRKLKVFRTPIGFHDAYVAAASRKAALEAWGSEANLFARGIAEQVTDEALMQEPLAHPGKVIRRSRGTAAEQIAALPPDTPRAQNGSRPRVSKSAKTSRNRATVREAEQPRRAPRPRPSRQGLERAEQALEALLAQQDEEEEKLRQRERALQDERRSLDDKHLNERSAAEAKLEQQQAKHAQALDEWLETQT